MVYQKLENYKMMRITNPIWNRHMSHVDRLFEDMRLAQLPEDGDIIERSRIVTEKFKVTHQPNGEITLTPIVEDEDAAGNE